MSQILERATSGLVLSLKAGSSVVDKVIDKTMEDVKHITQGNARFFDQPDEKVQEVRKLLDQNSDSKKLEGLKMLIALISKGRDVSEFFADVVKNVVASNSEVRKLVYIYLLRYAEKEPDLALLSINTFQKDLSDSNQFIRALSLRVMSGIRIEVIVPIVMLAIKKCISDLSPYVRKTAAHAVPKIYHLDPAQKPALVEVIETELNEKSVLVLGSVIMALWEVCPERLDLLHKHYRRFCHQIIDVDEWGQIAMLNVLLHYARTQFLDPNAHEGGEQAADGSKKEKAFYSDDEEEQEEGAEKTNASNTIDPDLRLLLTSVNPLLNSRNAGVIVGVAMIYYHLAPREELSKIAKPLTRLLGSHREVQYVVLSNIAVIAAKAPSAFEPHLKRFFVQSSDPTFIRTLKLDILTAVANENNINIVLRELQSYLKHSDKAFATAAIHALGRCAARLPEVSDACLSGLMGLVNNKNELIVAESVVVIKKLLQLHGSQHTDMILRLAKILPSIVVADARASIIWLIGEYSESIAKYAPDVLRLLAKTFVNEEDIVKLQILTLAAKLFVQGLAKSDVLFQYVFQLAKYDLSYDVRDRARLLRALCVLEEEETDGTNLAEHARDVLFAAKPPPIIDSYAIGRDRFNIGSLSSLLNSTAEGYEAIPDFPTEQPDASVRDVVEEKWFSKDDEDFDGGKKGKKSKKGKKPKKEKAPKDALDAFLNGGDDDEDEDDEDEDDEDDEGDDDDDDEDDEDEDDEDDDDEDEDDEDDENEEDDEDDEDEDEDEDDDDDDDEDDDDDDEEEEVVPVKGKGSKPVAAVVASSSSPKLSTSPSAASKLPKAAAPKAAVTSPKGAQAAAPKSQPKTASLLDL